MRVEVRLYAQLAAYLAAGSAGNRTELVLAEGATVADLLVLLGIPEDLSCSSIFLINEKHERRTRVLAEGDVICILPPIVGGSVGFPISGSLFPVFDSKPDALNYCPSIKQKFGTGQCPIQK